MVHVQRILRVVAHDRFDFLPQVNEVATCSELTGDPISTALRFSSVARIIIPKAFSTLRSFELLRMAAEKLMLRALAVATQPGTMLRWSKTRS